MDNGRDVQLVLEHTLVPVLERIAVANEELIRLATEERDIEDTTAPPHCPHCHQFDPVVGSQGGGEGHMSDFVLVAKCGSCGEVLYGLPDNWRMARSADEAHKIREGREAA